MAYDTKGSISVINNVPAGTAPENSAVLATLSNADYNTLAIQTVGTYTGALSLQVSVNGKNWITLGGNVFLNVGTGAWSATIPSAAQAIYQADVTGFGFARITALAAVTGSVVISVSASEGAGLVKLATGLPGTSAVSGTVIAQQSATAANGATTTYLNAAAGDNNTLIKATAGTIYAIVATNQTAQAKSVKLFAKATAPVAGVDTPAIPPIILPPNSTQVFTFGTVGLRFLLGIGVSITGGVLPNDATDLVAGDVQLTVEYA